MAAITLNTASIPDKLFTPSLDFLRISSEILRNDEDQSGFTRFAQHVIASMSGTEPTPRRELVRDRDMELSILLVDDNPLTLQLHTAILKTWKHSVDTATNGEEALKLHSNGKYDLMLMDLQMPVMGGVETTKKIREKEAGSLYHTTIIALTANSHDAERELCLAAGMDDYFIKPFSVENFHVFLIRHAVTIRHAMQPRQNGGAARFDYEAALKETDASIISRNVKPFLENLPEQLLTMRRAWERQDLAIFQREIYSLTEALSAFNAEPARRLATEIESNIRSRRIEKVQSLFQRLEDEIDLFCKHLDNYQVSKVG